MNNHFPIALHIVGFLASRKGEALTSQLMADVYGTSPVVLRRVLGKLQKAGVVHTQRGPNGGSLLAREASNINLREVYEAIRDNGSVLPAVSSKCSGAVAPVLANYIDELFADAEEALLRNLETVTVAKMDNVVRRRIIASARRGVKSR